MHGLLHARDWHVQELIVPARCRGIERSHACTCVKVIDGKASMQTTGVPGYAAKQKPCEDPNGDTMLCSHMQLR